MCWLRNWLGTAMLLSLAGVAPAWGQLQQLPDPALYDPVGPSLIQAPPQDPVFDLDEYLARPGVDTTPTNDWHWQVLPNGIIYQAYLAGEKESRLSAHLIHENEYDFLWDSTLGGRVGILRFGNTDPWKPEGFQIDVEGSAQVRLCVPDDVDVQATDYRGGVPLTYGIGQHRFKVGYYHISSHLGDEFLLDHPTYNRLNFARDTLYVGYAYFVTPNLRVYADIGWAFYIDVSQPWEFQFGFDYAPAYPTGLRGAPFFAMNGHLREELNFGGNLTVEAGWAWRADDSTHLLRTGLIYYNGASPQYSFYRNFEQQIGYGLWFDY